MQHWRWVWPVGGSQSQSHCWWQQMECEGDVLLQCWRWVWPVGGSQSQSHCWWQQMECEGDVLLQCWEEGGRWGEGSSLLYHWE